jgi:hypothetical protein
VLHIDPCVPGGTEWSDRLLRELAPSANITTLYASGLRLLWKALRSQKDNGVRFDQVVIPFRGRFAFTPWYLAVLVTVLYSRIGQVSLQDIQGDLRTVWRQYEPFLAPLLQPFAAVIICLRLPYYIWTEFVKKLVLAPSNPQDEIVGFGAGKGAGGLIYWQYMANIARRFGLFGLAHSAYMGIPSGLHSWPFAVWCFMKLGFRSYLYYSMALTVIGLAWLCMSSGHPELLALIPVVLFSTYYMFNVYVGTWEMLAWGIGTLVFAALQSGLASLAGVLLGIAVLSHPGVGMLVGGTAAMYAVFAADGGQSLAWLIMCSVGSAGWWVFPYWRASNKLGRSQMLRRVWVKVYRWTPKTVYALISYTAFAVVAMVSRGFTSQALVLVLPILVLYYNTKINWVFSEYTVYNYALIVGAGYVIANPDPASIVTYLIIINPLIPMLWDKPFTGSVLGFDLTPIRLGESREKIREAFSSLCSGRIGFEAGPTRSHPGWGAVAFLGYVLSDTEAWAFNIGYAEIGEYEVYEKYSSHFHAGVRREEFANACRGAAIKYMVAFTDGFQQCLEEWGCRPIKRLEGVNPSCVPSGQPIALTIFELPWETSLIEPVCDYTVRDNYIRMQVKEGVQYRIKLTRFPGWQATQGARKVQIDDMLPGMGILAVSDGLLELHYSVLHSYFR